MRLALVQLCNRHHWIQSLRAFWWRLRGIVDVGSKALHHFLHSFELALLQPVLTQISLVHHTDRVEQMQCHLKEHGQHGVWQQPQPRRGQGTVLEWLPLSVKALCQLGPQPQQSPLSHHR